MAAPKKNAQQKTISNFGLLLRILIQFTLSVAFLGGTAYLALIKHPDYILSHLPHLHTFADRQIFTLRCQTFSLLTLLSSIVLVILARVTTGVVNPLELNRENTILVFKQCLQNTLEQFVLSTTSQVILGTMLNEDEMKIIPLLAFYFVFGRVMFWLGYLLAPYYRTFGFMTTFIPNVFSVSWCVYLVVTRGVGFNLGTGVYTA